MQHPGWPARLAYGPVELAPLRRGDAAEWSRLRLANESWLRPWEPTAGVAWSVRHTPAAYRLMRRSVARRARAGTSMPFAVRVEGRLAGQVTVDNIVRGALRSGSLGYWVDRSVAGRGMASLAVALVCDHAFGPGGLHRLQADIRPENGPSQRLVERLGFSREGLLRRYLDIDGDWRDHLSYALLAEDSPRGVLAVWASRSPRV
ncbi:ribosomal-protein-alanine N-acetyltransferase [Geodermatophilus amargosae]|uniref:Ribosomal-protein-alanine N-acetyltransferase n=1 Tax=Geodermatophilus amargosae TaxID=1296565 RepID=A0A1I7A584_9ACTN|nr:GNAT family protein [Geodermatophilus amargosae]SFT70088.1 ribosomal-protein-alanine N-acetyltransferase [Geodermatophilus amargosae]